MELQGSQAQVVATTLTTFADRDERSVEDDVVYLVRSGEAWLVAKPSSTLYRSGRDRRRPPVGVSPRRADRPSLIAPRARSGKSPIERAAGAATMPVPRPERSST